jgi:hypothetical protein
MTLPNRDLFKPPSIAGIPALGMPPFQNLTDMSFFRQAQNNKPPRAAIYPAVVLAAFASLPMESAVHFFLRSARLGAGANNLK